MASLDVCAGQRDTVLLTRPRLTRNLDVLRPLREVRAVATGKAAILLARNAPRVRPTIGRRVSRGRTISRQHRVEVGHSSRDCAEPVDSGLDGERRGSFSLVPRRVALANGLLKMLGAGSKGKVQTLLDNLHEAVEARTDNDRTLTMREHFTAARDLLNTVAKLEQAVFTLVMARQRTGAPLLGGIPSSNATDHLDVEPGRTHHVGASNRAMEVNPVPRHTSNNNPMTATHPVRA